MLFLNTPENCMSWNHPTWTALVSIFSGMVHSGFFMILDEIKKLDILAACLNWIMIIYLCFRNVETVGLKIHLLEGNVLLVGVNLGKKKKHERKYTITSDVTHSMNLLEKWVYLVLPLTFTSIYNLASFVAVFFSWFWAMKSLFRDEFGWISKFFIEEEIL